MVLTAKRTEDNLGLLAGTGGNGLSGATRRQVSILLDLVRRMMDGRHFGKTWIYSKSLFRYRGLIIGPRGCPLYQNQIISFELTEFYRNLVQKSKLQYFIYRI
jgi:hypothetical protein